MHPPATSVSAAIKQRHSTRAYLNRDVDADVIHRILDTARYAPSGVNTQPWQVAVVTGSTKQIVQNKMLEQLQAGIKGKMDYDYYPAHWEAPYKERRAETGKQLYETLNISYEDKQRRLDQWAKNYRAFDAPVMLLFLMDACMGTGSFFDYGMFVNNIMLTAIEEGLATCPQGALGEYPEIIKESLGYRSDQILIGGMALGYEDKQDPVNGMRVGRLEVEDFTRFYG